ncbi:TraB/GumN family protein [Pseudoroseicyclus tamaricis]|uniref:TraB/GumN family protein n=1 Tax=Pseudoroseicyclus tamaricis TaxID=2705421 RepID=A0A6B2JTM2_9RHOB|nr:TraB/GumN family protein [Pseudoroseicyclus tamaricis]NDU99938.1 TraB/GumN family protein [Pseudoroseicyclus tamaricis]
MRRLLAPLAFALTALAGPLLAACDGPSLLETMGAEDRARLDAMAQEVPFGDGVIWRADKDGHRIILAGTMHLPDPRAEALTTRLSRIMKGADLALFEMTRKEEAEMTEALTEDPTRMLITEGPDLRERLDPQTWEVLSEAAEARGIPPVFAARVQPWFLVLTLSAPPCLAGGEALTGGLDHQLMDAATAAGIETRALEPWDTLLTIVEAADPEEELDMLRLSLQPPELQEQLFNAVLDLYFEECVGAIMALTTLSAELSPGVDLEEAMEANAMAEDALLYGRNDSWLPLILSAGEANAKTFVAVGAAHLPGERGLLQGLQDAGWTISPP